MRYALSGGAMKKNQEKDKKEQEILKKLHNGWIRFGTIMIDILCIIMIALGIYGVVINMSKEWHETAPFWGMIISFVLFFLLANFGAEKWLTKIIKIADERYNSANERKKTKIQDLDTALVMLKQQSGIVVWDTIWGIVVVFMCMCLLIGFDTCNKPVVIGVILFALAMLFGGHFVGKRLSKRRQYGKKLYKYSKQYMDCSDELGFLLDVDRSIQRGVISYNGLWMLTDEYMLGRLSDIAYELVAIQRKEVEKIVFFYERFYKRVDGMLLLSLKNGKSVKLCLGVGGNENCEPILKALNENGIPWEQGELRY